LNLCLPSTPLLDTPVTVNPRQLHDPPAMRLRAIHRFNRSSAPCPLPPTTNQKRSP